MLCVSEGGGRRLGILFWRSWELIDFEDIVD